MTQILTNQIRQAGGSSLRDRHHSPKICGTPGGFRFPLFLQLLLAWQEQRSLYKLAPPPFPPLKKPFK